MGAQISRLGPSQTAAILSSTEQKVKNVIDKLNELVVLISSTKHRLIPNPNKVLDGSEIKLQWLQRQLAAHSRSELKQMLEHIEITPEMIRYYSKEQLLQKIHEALQEQEGGARKSSIVNSEACHSRRNRRRSRRGGSTRKHHL